MKSISTILKLPAVVSQVKENRVFGGTRYGWDVTVLVLDGKGGESKFCLRIPEEHECPKLGDQWQMTLTPKQLKVSKNNVNP